MVCFPFSLRYGRQAVDDVLRVSFYLCTIAATMSQFPTVLDCVDSDAAPIATVGNTTCDFSFQ